MKVYYYMRIMDTSRGHFGMQGMNRHAEAKWQKALKMLNQVFDLGNDDGLARVSCSPNSPIAAD